MSVWFTETFRGQALWDLAKLGTINEDSWSTIGRKTDIEFTGGKLPAIDDYDEIAFPTGRCEEILNRMHPNYQSVKRTFYDHGKETAKKGRHGHVALKVDEQVKRYRCGLGAVYKVYGELLKLGPTFCAQEAKTQNSFVGGFLEMAYRSQVGIMKTVPKVAFESFSRLDDKALVEAARLQCIANRVRQLLTYRWKSKVARESNGYFERDRKRGEILTSWADDEPFRFPDSWDLYFDGWITYLRTDDLDEDEIYMLTSSDVDRLQQMLISRSMLEVHQATWALTAGNSLDAYKATKKPLLRLFDESLSKSASFDPGTNPNNLCRDYRKCFNAYLSMAAGPLSDEGTSEMLAEIHAKHYNRNFSVHKYIGLLKRTPFDIAQDLGRIYKLLPAPDYDIGSSFCARKDQHDNMNPYNPIEGDNPCNYEEFEQYLRKMMIVTLVRANGNKGVGNYYGRKKPRWWDKYLSQGVLPPDLAAVNTIDLRGAAAYVERTPESVALWKDSAVCEEDLDEVLEAKETLSPKRNMLLRYLFDNTCPDANSARNSLYRKQHVHRVGFKMEAHKTEARLFFIGNMSDRLIQSEMEENVHRVALNCPGYVIGQTPEYNTAKIMSMVAPKMQYDEKVYFLNFDISAWSPGMRDDIQRMSHAIWAEVFDRPEFLNAHRINEGSYVALNKRGYVGYYRNPGANFEGYNGKEMTFLHCALMGYSVYRYRRETGDNLTVSLCAYIDDGLASIRDKIANGPDRFLKFADIVEETYKSLGFLLEKSKCYMSDSFAIFLNEIYLSGRHVTYGLRAIMRVGTKEFENHETLSDRMNAYFSGTQGAMKAGLDVLAGFVIFLWLSARLLLAYDARKFFDPRAAVLYALTPRALGGLGMPNYVALSSNLVTDPLAEGISTLQELCRTYEDYKPKVISVLRQPVGLKAEVGMLMCPSTVSDHLVPLIESRLRSAVARALKRKDLSRRAREYIRMSSNNDMEQLAKAVLTESNNVCTTVMKDLVDATPTALFLALIRKFESARTMTALVGSHQMDKIAALNRGDISLSMRAFVHR